MEIEWADEKGVPLPPGDIRFLRITAEPYGDGRRIKLSYELTPFQKRPNVEIRLEDEQGGELGAISVIETMTPRFTLTAHLRSEVPAERSVRVRSVLGYEDQPEVDHALTPVEPAPGQPHPA